MLAVVVEEVLLQLEVLVELAAAVPVDPHLLDQVFQVRQILVVVVAEEQEMHLVPEVLEVLEVPVLLSFNIKVRL